MQNHIPSDAGWLLDEYDIERFWSRVHNVTRTGTLPITQVRRSHSQRRGVAMYPCDYCGTLYPSPLAAAECEEADRRDALHARQMLRGRGK